MERPETAIVCTGGAPVDGAVAAELPGDATVIAADSGLAIAIALGLRVELVVGDLDSVDPDALEDARARGTAVEQHPVDKNATDVELALDAAVRLGARRIVVVGGLGGRLDHLLGNVLVLASPRFAGVEIELLSGPLRVLVIRERARIDAAPGTLVSLLPVGGPARRVRTTGLRYPLADEDLEPGTTRGVSNVVTDSPATVELEAGTLLAVLPDSEASTREQP